MTTALTGHVNINLIAFQTPNHSRVHHVSTPTSRPMKRPILLCNLVSSTQTLEAENFQESDTHVHYNSKSIWVNPSRPLSSIPSLQRPRRHAKWDATQFRDLRLYAERLSNFEGPQDALLVLINGIPHPPTRDNALCVLYNLNSWDKSYAFFNWLKMERSFPMETIFYNVVMKSLRSGDRFDLVQKLAFEMIDRGIELDLITYSTVVTAAKRSNLLPKAEEWFARMCDSGVTPDEMTCSSMLDFYAQLGKGEEMKSLYKRGKLAEWKFDQITLSILAKGFGNAGDSEGINFVLEEVRSLGIQPNPVLLNKLLVAMGKAEKPDMAKEFFKEMLDSGVTPNEHAVTTILGIYCKSRWVHDALNLWEEIRHRELKIDVILYNMLLNICADIGFEEKAEKIFEDMKCSEDCKPDSYSYTAMLNVYGNCGKVDKVMEFFEEMLGLGVKLNPMSCTCLIRCLGKAKKIEDMVRVFGIAVEKGVGLDGKLCGCLLYVFSLCDDVEDREKVLTCVQAANPKLATFVELLEEESTSMETIRSEFKSIIDEAVLDVRRPFCNCFIDICRNKGLVERAAELLQLGKFCRLYGRLHERTEDGWRLNLRALSVGASQTALEEWLKSLSVLVERGADLPEVFLVRTGAGNHKYSLGLGDAFAAHAEKLAAPFRQREDNMGVFVASKEEIVSWVKSRQLSLSHHE